VIQGLLAGLGFIGGGAIFRSDSGVHGTATAASIFTTGVLGAAVAEDRYIFAAVLGFVNLISLRVLLPIKTKIDQEKSQSLDL
jgi:putative Mg2+ transporter-C (MgtC) family protein